MAMPYLNKGDGRIFIKRLFYHSLGWCFFYLFLSIHIFRILVHNQIIITTKGGHQIKSEGLPESEGVDENKKDGGDERGRKMKEMRMGEGRKVNKMNKG